MTNPFYDQMVKHIERTLKLSPKQEPLKPWEYEKDKIEERTMPCIALLEQGVKEEEDAVVLYTKLMNKAENPRVKELFKHVIEEEKHHADEFRELIAELRKAK